jgi:hypothetical protein
MLAVALEVLAVHVWTGIPSPAHSLRPDPPRSRLTDQSVWDS